MIFVTVGTTQHFDELISEIDRLKASGVIKDEVVAQIGPGNYIPTHLDWFRFTDKIGKYFDEADLCICHGGVGSVFELLGLGKKFIAVANKHMQDDHQTDLLKVISKRGWCGCCLDVSNLNEFFINDFNVNEYQLEEDLSAYLWNNIKSGEL